MPGTQNKKSNTKPIILLFQRDPGENLKYLHRINIDQFGGVVYIFCINHIHLCQYSDKPNNTIINPMFQGVIHIFTNKFKGHFLRFLSTISLTFFSPLITIKYHCPFLHPLPFQTFPTNPKPLIYIFLLDEYQR